ncbi:hypothetical protein LC609_19325 [Nostoc sp. XA013]|nr:hypothetical protein [Nostoc sp. XA013]
MQLMGDTRLHQSSAATGIQCLWVAVSMEISTQRDSQEVVRRIGQSFPQLMSHATPVVK